MTSAPPPGPAPLDPVSDGSGPPPRGVAGAAVHAGRKSDGALDVALLVSATSCARAGGFTRNAVRAAPVVYDPELLAERPGRIRAVAMNARIANACTGSEGLAATRAMAQAAEQAAALPPRTALVLSTGVIGVSLPVPQIADGLRQAAARLSVAGGVAAAQAIMTTATRPKHYAVRFETPGGLVTVGGIAKGAGMIHPDMATLLAVLTTDAAGEPATLQPLLRRVADRSFNAISVDGDTSTNDSVLLLANGASGVDPSRDGAVWKTFEDAVQEVARALALAIVTDGEGASKVLEIQVAGAVSEAAAREVGRAIARSTLVKTAIYGGDPNWGRVLAAAGNAGVTLAVERLSLHRGGLLPHHDRRSGEEGQREQRATHHVSLPPEGARTTMARFTVETHAHPPASRRLQRYGLQHQRLGGVMVSGRRARVTVPRSGLGGPGTLGSCCRTTVIASSRVRPRCTSWSAAVETSSRRSRWRPSWTASMINPADESGSKPWATRSAIAWIAGPRGGCGSSATTRSIVEGGSFRRSAQATVVTSPGRTGG